MSKLTGLYPLISGLKPDPFIFEAKKRIDTELDTAMTSEEEFMSFIDGLVNDFTRELMKRYSKNP